LLTFFIPKFQGIFKGLGAALPLPTQIVLAASQILRSYGFFVLIGLVIIGALVRNGSRPKPGGGYGKVSFYGRPSSVL
jgi:type II secretory pathway component PulF